MDNKQIIKSLIDLIGDDSNRKELAQTPQRFINAIPEIFSGYNTNLDQIFENLMPNDDQYHGEITCKPIDFLSFCEHHILPITGTAEISYTPDKVLIGVGKIPFLVKSVASRLQTQERITQTIYDLMLKNLKPKFLNISISCKHYCMSARGEKSHANVSTKISSPHR